MIEIIGKGLLWCGLVICFLGVVAFNRCKSFDAKLLTVSIVDGCGLLTFMVGAMLVSDLGMSKIVLILLTVLIISPLTSHEIARLSRQKEKESE